LFNPESQSSTIWSKAGKTEEFARRKKNGFTAAIKRKRRRSSGGERATGDIGRWERMFLEKRTPGKKRIRCFLQDPHRGRCNLSTRGRFWRRSNLKEKTEMSGAVGGGVYLGVNIRRRSLRHYFNI